jgi:hypothetical protein
VKRIYTVFYHEKGEFYGHYSHPSLVVEAADVGKAIAAARKIIDLPASSIVVDEVCLDIPGAEDRLATAELERA